MAHFVSEAVLLCAKVILKMCFTKLIELDTRPAIKVLVEPCHDDLVLLLLNWQRNDDDFKHTLDNGVNRNWQLHFATVLAFELFKQIERRSGKSFFRHEFRSWESHHGVAPANLEELAPRQVGASWQSALPRDADFVFS